MLNEDAINYLSAASLGIKPGSPVETIDDLLSAANKDGRKQEAKAIKDYMWKVEAVDEMLKSGMTPEKVAKHFEREARSGGINARGYAQQGMIGAALPDAPAAATSVIGSGLASAWNAAGAEIAADVASWARTPDGQAEIQARINNLKARPARLDALEAGEGLGIKPGATEEQFAAAITDSEAAHDHDRTDAIKTYRGHAMTVHRLFREGEKPAQFVDKLESEYQNASMMERTFLALAAVGLLGIAAGATAVAAPWLILASTVGVVGGIGAGCLIDPKKKAIEATQNWLETPAGEAEVNAQATQLANHARPKLVTAHA